MLEIGTIVKTLIAVVVIVDPIAAVPIFLTMTRGDDENARRRMAWRASLVAGVTLTVFAAVGESLFVFLGISLGAFRIAGGLLLFLLAVDMLLAKPSRQRSTPEEAQEGVQKPDVSVFPLGIPMLAGPGAITAVMMLRGNARSVVEHATIFGAITAVSLLTFIILSQAARIELRLGQTGMNVMHRVLGLLLAAIAAQFVVDGVKAAFGLS
jgi:multiple antibiotic resistance protein